MSPLQTARGEPFPPAPLGKGRNRVQGLGQLCSCGGETCLTPVLRKLSRAPMGGCESLRGREGGGFRTERRGLGSADWELSRRSGTLHGWKHVLLVWVVRPAERETGV